MKLIAGALVVFLLAGSPAFSAEWLSIPDNDRVFDKTSVKLQKNGHVTAWIKFSFSRNDVEKLTTSNKAYTNYSHTLYLNDFDCINGRYKTLSIAMYAKDGSILDSFNENPDPNFVYIPPGSEIDAVINTVCNFASKKMQSN